MGSIVTISFPVYVILTFINGLIILGKIEVDPDAEAEAVATICMISTPPALRVAESEYMHFRQ